MINFLQNVIKIFITFYLPEISESIMLIRRKDYMDRLRLGSEDGIDTVNLYDWLLND